jgi:putative tryptophan/tyrosine transport system substrate-binding protein
VVAPLKQATMKRREFIILLGCGAATWPHIARAQQPTLPVIGFMNVTSARNYTRQLAAFLNGLGETGYVDGRNVKIEYRWAEDQIDRLPTMAADLVQKQVAVIAATSTPAALAAKVATTTIPIVFETGGDPIKLGLVASLSRPGGNITGAGSMAIEIFAAKGLELLHELIPAARVIALLVNPTDPAVAKPQEREVLATARALGLEVHVLHAASSQRDFDNVFAKLIELHAAGLLISADAFFTSQSQQLAALAVRHAVPAVHARRSFAVAGGLLSYGSDLTDSYRIAGYYTGRILKGDKPADLPVQLATKVELVINLKTAKMLGITIPLSLSGRADELIE